MQEVTGNQCIQSPILHQYSVSPALRRPVYLAASLSCLFFFSYSLCSVSLKAHCRQLYFKYNTLFPCFVFKWSDRKMQVWRQVGWWVRWTSWLLGVRFLLNQIFRRWWQLEECSANSPNTGHVTLWARLPSRTVWAAWVGGREKCLKHILVDLIIITNSVRLQWWPWKDVAVCGQTRL